VLRGLEQLAERHRDVVFRVVARIVGNDEAQDVTHGTRVAILHRLGRCADDIPTGAWLMCARQPAVRPVTPSGRVAPLDATSRARPEPQRP
jgi:hypothetical protein